MTECIFCGIVAGHRDATVAHRDEEVEDDEVVVRSDALGPTQQLATAHT